MCGRYELRVEGGGALQTIIDQLNRKQGAQAHAEICSGEIFPTDAVPVITARGAAVMRWGMPRHDGKGVHINARSETVSQLRTFAQAFERRRIAVPTDGFYEWMRKEGNAKHKHHFTLPGEDTLYLAGIFSEYSLPSGVECRFAILTAEANDSMIRFHDRMPVILRKGEVDAWIGDRQAAEAFLRRPQPALIARPAEPEPPRAPKQLSLFDEN